MTMQFPIATLQIYSPLWVCSYILHVMTGLIEILFLICLSVYCVHKSRAETSWDCSPQYDPNPADGLVLALGPLVAPKMQLIYPNPLLQLPTLWRSNLGFSLSGWFRAECINGTTSCVSSSSITMQWDIQVVSAIINELHFTYSYTFNPTSRQIQLNVNFLSCSVNATFKGELRSWTMLSMSISPNTNNVSTINVWLNASRVLAQTGQCSVPDFQSQMKGIATLSSITTTSQSSIFNLRAFDRPATDRNILDIFAMVPDTSNYTYVDQDINSNSGRLLAVGPIIPYKNATLGTTKRLLSLSSFWASLRLNVENAPAVTVETGIPIFTILAPSGASVTIWWIRTPSESNTSSKTLVVTTLSSSDPSCPIGNNTGVTASSPLPITSGTTTMWRSIYITGSRNVLGTTITLFVDDLQTQVLVQKSFVYETVSFWSYMTPISKCALSEIPIDIRIASIRVKNETTQISSFVKSDVAALDNFDYCNIGQNLDSSLFPGDPCSGHGIYDIANKTCTCERIRTGPGCRRCIQGSTVLSSLSGDPFGLCFCPKGTAYNQTACADCPAGFYNNVPNGDCQRCQPGTYSLSPGYLDCTACPAGKFSFLSGQSRCMNCADGLYSLQNSSSCLSCPNGTIPTLGQTSCQGCAPGKFATSAKCFDCPLGRASDIWNASACSLCGPGEYTNITGQTRCAQCIPGKYAPSFGEVGCIDCPAGTWTSTAGSGTCLNCTTGSVARPGSTTCTWCLAGTYVATNRSCVSCPEGTASNNYSTSCYNCPNGTISIASRVSCTNCTTGKWSNSTHCLDCPAGKSSNGTAVQCFSCVPGRYNGEPGSTCKLCPAGYYSDTYGVNTCSLCSAGKFSTSGVDECSTCESGTVSSAGQPFCNGCHSGTYANISGCLPCPTGYFSHSNSSSCTVCPPGSVASSGSPECAPCRAGTFAYNTTCEQCPLGTMSFPGSASCIECVGGARSSADATACILCEAGKYSSPRSDACSQCPEGTVSSLGQSSCKDCPPSTYASTSRCLPCPMGQVNDRFNSIDCTHCLSGTMPNYEGTMCSNCSSGTYSSDGTFCSPCPLGKFTESVGSVDCQTCGPGSVAQDGQSSCSRCPEGTGPSYFNSVCKPCESGLFSDTSTNGTCKQCPSGYFSNKPGQTKCYPCPVGRYSNSTGLGQDCFLCNTTGYSDAEASIECKSCPDHSSVTNPSSAVSKKDCSCNIGYFHNETADPEGFVCDLCSEGFECNRFGVKEPLSVEQGYFVDIISDKYAAFKCDPAEACYSSVGATTQCKELYEGFRCSVCVESISYRQQQECRACGSNVLGFVVMVLVFITFCAVFLFVAKPSSSPLSAISMFLSNLQIIAVFATSLTSKWTPEIKSLWQSFSILNFNLELFRPECAVHVSYWSKQQLKFSLPFISFVFLLIFGTSYVTLKKLLGHDTKNLSTSMKERIYFASNLVLVFGYTLLVSAATDPLNCQNAGRGRLFLKREPSISCTSDEYNSNILFSYIALMGYGIGIPSFYTAVLWRNYRPNTPFSETFLNRFGGLISPYNSNFFWWEIINMIRRLTIIVVIDTVSTKFFQLFLILSILFISLLLQAFYNPYRTNEENRLAALWSLVTILILFSAAILESGDTSGAGPTPDESKMLTVLVFLGFFGTVLYTARCLLSELYASRKVLFSAIGSKRKKNKKLAKRGSKTGSPREPGMNHNVRGAGFPVMATMSRNSVTTSYFNHLPQIQTSDQSPEPYYRTFGQQQ